MAEARLDVGGSTEEAQRAIDKLTKRVASLTDQMRKMRDQSVKGAQEATSAQLQYAAASYHLTMCTGHSIKGATCGTYR